MDVDPSSTTPVDKLLRNFNFSLFLAWLQLSWQLVSLRPPARGSNHVATNRAEKKGDAHEAMGLAPRRQESHRRGCSPMPDTKSLHAIRSNVKALNASKVPTSRITTKRSLLRSKWRRPHQEKVAQTGSTITLSRPPSASARNRQETTRVWVRFISDLNEMSEIEIHLRPE